MDEYALVTGASKGIGRSIAVLLAKRKYNLLLVARSADELEDLKRVLSLEYGIKVDFFVTDLSLPDAAIKVADWCDVHSYSVSILINNAGYGLWGKFGNLSIEEQLNSIQLNINAVTELTFRMLPALKKCRKAYILNVASTAAYQAVPTLAVYAASKAYVLSFSRAIRIELKDTSVSVTCISPGPVATGFAERAGLSVIKDLAEKFNMDPDVVAEVALTAMFNKKSEVIPGFTNRISAYANRFLPKSVIEYVAASLYKTR